MKSNQKTRLKKKKEESEGAYEWQNKRGSCRDIWEAMKDEKGEKEKEMRDPNRRGFEFKASYSSRHTQIERETKREYKIDFRCNF